MKKLREYGYRAPLALAIVAAFLTAFSISAEAKRSPAHPAEVREIVVEEALNTIVPPSLALAVAKVESNFNPEALSSAGARGVMQIMPATARSEFGISADELWKTRLNIQLGIDYLGQLIRQYGGRWDLALSHYNGGTLKGKGANAIPHSYTRKYVAAVLKLERVYASQAKVWRTARTNPRDTGWVPARTRVREDVGYIGTADFKAIAEHAQRIAAANRDRFRAIEKRSGRVPGSFVKAEVETPAAARWHGPRTDETAFLRERIVEQQRRIRSLQNRLDRPAPYRRWAPLKDFWWDP